MGKFKELRVWQDAVSLAEKIYAITNTTLFSKDYGLKDQIRRATVSISSNLAEGDERGSNRQSVHFFNIAKGSAAEVITQLHIANRVGYLEKEVFEALEQETDLLRAAIKNLIKARGGDNPLNQLGWFFLKILKPF
ncbi:MAG: four helix bundle protein [Saprospiraceae bacterium]|nr:four helix bundle protein [Saprospiraceae bacterium]